MAIMAGAAIVGGMSVGTTVAGIVITAEIVGMVALGATVIGAVTGNKTLSKIGGGLGLGAGVAGLLETAGTTAAKEGAETALVDQAMQEGGEQAAEQGSIQQMLDGDEAVLPPGETATPGTVEATQGPAASEGLVDRAMGPYQESAVQQSQGVPSAADEALGKAQTVGKTVDTSTPFKSEYGFDLSGKTATGTTSTGALKTSDSWFGDTFKGISDWWGNLDAKEKLAAAQMGSGLVQGIGGGVGNYMTNERKMQFEEEARDYRRANLANVPAIGYKRPPGLINSKLGA